MTRSDEASDRVLLAVYELTGGSTGTPIAVTDVAAKVDLPAETVRDAVAELLDAAALRYAEKPESLYLSHAGRAWVEARRGSGSGHN